MTTGLSMLDDSNEYDKVDNGEGEAEALPTDTGTPVDFGDGDVDLGSDADAASTDGSNTDKSLDENPVGAGAGSEPTGNTAGAVDDPVQKAEKALEGRLAAMLDEREKKKAAELRVQELERQLAQYTQEAPKAPEVPDPVVDPNGFYRFMQEQQEARLTEVRVEDSIHIAVNEHGAEVVEAARQWAASRYDEGDVALTVNALKQRQPMKYVVDEYLKSQKVQAIVSDEDAYFERMARERGWAPVVTANTTVTTAPNKAATTQTRKPTLAELESVRGGSQDEPPISMLDL